MTKIDLREEATYGSAARAVLAARTDDVFAHEPEKLLDARQPEGVHKMRVATRRLRAALEIFGPALPDKRPKASLAEVKLLADALGERRDCDVQIEFLERLRAEAHRGERHAIDGLLADLRREQDRANERLSAALKHAHHAHLERRLRELAR
jgi:CHAD domain-containing protein